MFYNVFFTFYEQMKMILWSIRTSGIRVRPKARKNDKFEKRTISLKNSSPDLKADFPKQVKKSMKSTIHKAL